MAGKVLGSSNLQPEVVEGSENEVLSVTEAEVLAVSNTNDRGVRETHLVLVFGKMEDERPGVFILANPSEMKKQLRIASTWMRDGVLKKIGEMQPVEADDIPDSGATP